MRLRLDPAVFGMCRWINCSWFMASGRVAASAWQRSRGSHGIGAFERLPPLCRKFLREGVELAVQPVEGRHQGEFLLGVFVAFLELRGRLVGPDHGRAGFSKHGEKRWGVLVEGVGEADEIERFQALLGCLERGFVHLFLGQRLDARVILGLVDAAGGELVVEFVEIDRQA